MMGRNDVFGARCARKGSIGMISTPEQTRQALIQEVSALPDAVLPELLDYVRFLRLRTLSDEEINRRFLSALSAARAIAAEEKISEADIDYEIQQYRDQQ
jgi:hypothetical protein